MKFELGTLDWTVIISAISTVILLFALLWAMFSPGHKEKNRKKEEASFLRVSIRLYLDVLNDKLKRVLERTLHDQSPLGGDFERLAKQNHDVLENLFLGSDPLEFEERKKLRAFVHFFKGTPEMENREAFEDYKKELEALMKVFPEEKTN